MASSGFTSEKLRYKVGHRDATFLKKPIALYILE